MASGRYTFEAGGVPAELTVKADYSGATGGSAVVSGGALVTTLPAQAFLAVTVFRDVDDLGPDLDLTARVQLDAGLAEHYPAVAWRVTDTTAGDDGSPWVEWGGPFDGFYAYLNVAAGAVATMRLDSGFEDEGGPADAEQPFSFTASGVYDVRVLVEGSAHKVAVWPAAGSQAGWLIEFTDTVKASNNRWGLSDAGAPSVVTRWLDVAWSDLASLEPALQAPSPLRVRDAAGWALVVP